MNGTTHSVVGLATVATVAATNFPTMDLGVVTVFPLIAIPTAAIGALAADIDMEGTTISHKFPLLNKLLTGKAIPVVGSKIKTTHRGITHTPLVCIGLFLLLNLFVGDMFILEVIASLLFGFVLGYCSHVFIDVFNGAGIPHLWPLVWKRMYMTRVVTGSFEEPLYMVVYIALCALHVVCYYGGFFI